MLSDLIEEHAGRSLGELYAERLFAPAGMETAGADRRHERSGRRDGRLRGQRRAIGLFPATNRIYWTGDAGHLGLARGHAGLGTFHRQPRARTRTASTAGCREPPRVLRRDAGRATGYGLAHEKVGELDATGPRRRTARLPAAAAARCRAAAVGGGACSTTGRRLRRRRRGDEGGARMPAEPAGAPAEIARLGRRLHRPGDGPRAAAWSPATAACAHFRDGAGNADRRGRTGWRAVRRHDARARRRRRFGWSAPGENFADGCDAAVGRGERRHRRPLPFGGARRRRSRSSRPAAAFYGGFEGMLGTGPMQPLYPSAEDVWLMPCQRSMDAPAPGDWTVRVRRDAGGGGARPDRRLLAGPARGLPSRASELALSWRGAAPVRRQFLTVSSRKKRPSGFW